MVTLVLSFPDLIAMGIMPVVDKDTAIDNGGADVMYLPPGRGMRAKRVYGADESLRDWRHRGGTNCRCDWCLTPYSRAKEKETMAALVYEYDVDVLEPGLEMEMETRKAEAIAANWDLRENAMDRAWHIKHHQPLPDAIYDLPPSAASLLREAAREIMKSVRIVEAACS